MMLRCSRSIRGASATLARWAAGVAVTAALAPGPHAPAAAQVARFVAPAAGEIVAGPTEVRFEVLDETSGIERIEVFLDGRMVGTARPSSYTFSFSAPATGLGGATLEAVVVAGGRAVERLSLRTSSLRVDDVTDVLAVELLPAVALPGGAPARGLSTEDFVVLDDGEPARITTFADDSSPLSVALLVDRSVSMTDRLESVRESAARFVERLGPADRVAVWAFDHELAQLASWRSSGATATDGLRSLEPGGSTSLHDALIAVLAELRAAPGRRMLVLISDGRDVRSTRRLGDVLERARATDTAIYAISTAVPSAVAPRDDLALLAHESGGRLVEALGRKDLDRALSSLLDEARSRYALTFAPASLRPGEHRVTVLVRGGELEVRHRRSFVLASR
jgi:Ca-activated chloride channel family protein